MKKRLKKLYTQADLDNEKALLLAEKKQLVLEFAESLGVDSEKVAKLLNKDDSDCFQNSVAYISNSFNDKNEEVFDEILHREGFFISEYSYYSDIISGLLSSIKNNVELSASPLSHKIYELKKVNSEFLNTFSTWKNEIDSNDSKINYNHVVATFKEQSEKFKFFGDNIEKDFTYIRGSLRKVEEMFNKISDITKNIDDIASNIKTLSINASIEAARAGEHGKGFKVIALGTKDLSDQTNKLLESIVTTVEETKGIIFSASNTIEKQREYVHKHRDDQHKGYEDFYNILVEFYSKFQDVFYKVSKGSESSSKHIDGVAPMIQLHDALIQEVDNISKMLVKLNASYSDVISETLSNLNNSELENLLNNIVTHFEEQITTDGEVEVLGNFAKKHNLNRSRKIEKVDQDIEFF